MTQPPEERKRRKAPDGCHITTVSLPTEVKEYLDGEAGRTKRSRSNVAALLLSFCMSRGISVDNISVITSIPLAADRQVA
jgi:hypothetical protein